MDSRVKIFAAAALAASAGLLIAGPLTPPAGSVSSTYKTLSDVEPRSAIGPSTTPGTAAAFYRITQPGSYYLTGNLTAAAGKIGIQIAADDVTLDLNGFAVLGNDAGTTGIHADGLLKRITVRNGVVRDWNGAAVDLGLVDASTIRDVRAEGSLRGIAIGYRSTIQDCFATANTEDGIFGLNSTRIVGSTARANRDGIVVANSSHAESCISADNRGSGIVAYNYAVVDRCIASANLDNGVEAGAFVEVKGCSVQDNSGDGIQFNGYCTITDNVVVGGAFAGLHSLPTGASRSVVRGNNCSANQVGIQVDGTSNLIVGNTCTMNTTNFRIAASNRVATIVTMAVSGAIDGNTGGTAVSTPEANFAY